MMYDMETTEQLKLRIAIKKKANIRKYAQNKMRYFYLIPTEISMIYFKFQITY